MGHRSARRTRFRLLSTAVKDAGLVAETAVLIVLNFLVRLTSLLAFRAGCPLVRDIAFVLGGIFQPECKAAQGFPLKQLELACYLLPA